MSYLSVYACLLPLHATIPLVFSLSLSLSLSLISSRRSFTSFIYLSFLHFLQCPSSVFISRANCRGDSVLLICRESRVFRLLLFFFSVTSQEVKMEGESCIPPGFRFHPTEEELVGYYLARKVSDLKIDLDVITDVDLYRIEPWDLQDKCKLGYEEQTEWYFFSHKDKKYPTGTRTNRATAAGFWKATGRDKAVFSKYKLIGMRKTLVFYKGRAPNGRKTDWIMHEYRLESHENAQPQDEGWVVCRAFKKPIPSQKPNSSTWSHGVFSASFMNQARAYQLSLSGLDDSEPINSSSAFGCNIDELLVPSKLHTAETQVLHLPQLQRPSVLLPSQLYREASCHSSYDSPRNEGNEGNGYQCFDNTEAHLAPWACMDSHGQHSETTSDSNCYSIPLFHLEKQSVEQYQPQFFPHDSFPNP